MPSLHSKKHFYPEGYGEGIWEKASACAYQKQGVCVQDEQVYLKGGRWTWALMVAASRWLLASSTSSRLHGTRAKAAKATRAFSPNFQEHHSWQFALISHATWEAAWVMLQGFAWCLMMLLLVFQMLAALILFWSGVLCSIQGITFPWVASATTHCSHSLDLTFVLLSFPAYWRLPLESIADTLALHAGFVFMTDLKQI